MHTVLTHIKIMMHCPFNFFWKEGGEMLSESYHNNTLDVGNFTIINCCMLQRWGVLTFELCLKTLEELIFVWINLVGYYSDSRPVKKEKKSPLYSSSYFIHDHSVRNGIKETKVEILYIYICKCKCAHACNFRRGESLLTQHREMWVWYWLGWNLS